MSSSSSPIVGHCTPQGSKVFPRHPQLPPPSFTEATNMAASNASSGGASASFPRAHFSGARNSSRTSQRSIPIPLEPLKEGHRMDPQERLFLEAAERGDKHTMIRCLQGPNAVNVNCTNILGRSAIQIAVDNENVEIVELLLKQEGVKIGDALLYAIREGVYRIVEMLIDHPSITREMLGSEWKKHKLPDEESSDYSSDISPVILAAHCNQFEILQLLLSRGARIDKPHALSCSCRRCEKETAEDSLRHSLLRIHTYRALTSPAWVSLTSSDPVLTAFKMSWELEHLAMRENEFKDLYAELSEQCKKYACDLLDQCRSSEEVIAVLNKGSDSDDDDDSDSEGDEINTDKLTLSRLKLALKYEQKQFVAHPHCQQLLASIWYEGIPGWRKRSFVAKIVIIISLIMLMPLMAVYYLILPRSRLGQIIRTPFMKFMYHSATFGVFLVLLILASTNVSAGDDDQLIRQQQRGPAPSALEWLILIYVTGFIWGECKQLWEEGLKAYVRQWWNWLDFIMLSMYLCTFSLRVVAYVQAQYPDYYGSSIMPRNEWPVADPTLVSEGVFAIANVFSFARIIFLFQAQPQLGPLQISLGCMLIDIGKFLFIFFLVLISFACGLNQLYYYYSNSADIVDPNGVNGGAAGGPGEHGGLLGSVTMSLTMDLAGNNVSTSNVNVLLPDETPTMDPFENAFDPIWNSFKNLFWALFGLTPLSTVREGDIQPFTKLVGEGLLMAYHALAIIMLINMLIAMMSNSFQNIEDHADREWKFARSKLWMGYFDEGCTLPPPFNLIVSPKSVYYFCLKVKRFIDGYWYGRKKTRHHGAVRRHSIEGTIKLLPQDNNNYHTHKHHGNNLSISVIGYANNHVYDDGAGPGGLEDDDGNNIDNVLPNNYQGPQVGQEQSPNQNGDPGHRPQSAPRYQDVMRRLVSRFIHHWKKQMRQDGVNEDDLLEIKQDISSLRYELREDRKRESARTSGHIDNLKREILRSIRASSLGQIVPEPPPGPSSSSSLPHQMSGGGGGEGDQAGGRGGIPASFGSNLSASDIDILKQEIVGSLRQEIRELAREMASLHRQGSPVNPSINPGLIPPPPPPSDLYQTHLYTQL